MSKNRFEKGANLGDFSNDFSKAFRNCFRKSPLPLGQFRLKKLTEKLIAENSGILNWIMKGYAMWKKEGLGDEPQAVHDAINERVMSQK